MQNWILLKNELIKRTDQEAVERSLKAPMKNTLKTLVKVQNSATTTFSENALYGARMYVKVTVGDGLNACLVATYFASRIFKEIRLMTKRGTVLQTIIPAYTQAPLDEVFSTPYILTYL